MHEQTSPEEKLLGLIRKKDSGVAKNAIDAKPTANSAPGAQKPDAPSKDNKILFRISERALMGAAVILAGYMAYEFLFVSEVKARSVQQPGASSEDVSTAEITLAQPKPYSYYEEQILKRDIFESPMYKKAEGGAKGPASGSELTKNLKLVGIVLDEDPLAIVEDMSVQQTFFLHKGDRIQEATVDEIQESKVILMYADQRLELVQ